MKVEHVPIQYVHVMWPIVAPMLAALWDSDPVPAPGADECSMEQMQMLLSDGRWQLLVIMDDNAVVGVMLVNVFNRPQHRVAFVQAIAGRFVITDEVMTQLQQYARQWGASKLECACRPAMQRLLSRVGMVEKYTVLEVRL